MGSYLIRRFLLMLLTLFGISVLVFVMLRLVPGNIADILFDSAGMIDTAEKGKLEHDLGLDKPIVVQYANWIGGLAHGDLGYSYVSEKPAVDEILPRIPITAKLAGLALLFSVLFGVPLGVISAVRQNSALDYVLRVISLSGLSMPAFWLGLLILMAFVDLVRHHPDLHRPAARILEFAVALQRAGGGGRLSLIGAGHAPDPLFDAGSAAARLHPHRAGERRLRRQRQLSSCAA